jgi:hypothetical protein
VAQVPDRTFDPNPRTRRWLAIGAALLTALAVLGLWDRTTREAEPMSDETADPAGLFLASQASGTSLAAVGRLDGLPLPCTAWLLEVGAPASAPGIAVTSGRCVGIDDSTTVLLDEPVRDAALLLRHFAPVTSAKPADSIPVPVEAVEWASTRWRDLALLRLAATYGELAEQGVRPIPAVAAPAEGTAILVAGVPVDGIPPEQRYLRGSRCTIGGTTTLVEQPGLFEDVRASDCTGILGGSSGSAALNPDGAAVGMVTSTTIGGGDDGSCAMGSPCEVGPDGVRSAADATYLAAVDDLPACFADGTFRLGGACRLEDPAGVAAAEAEAASAPPGSTVVVRLDPARPAPDAVASRQGALGTTTCSDPAGWGEPAPGEGWTLDLVLPDEPGWALACVGSPEQPTPVVVRAVAG